MDPDVILEDIRELQIEVLQSVDNGTFPSIGWREAQELAEKVRALDEWLSKGGFPPKGWDHARK